MKQKWILSIICVMLVILGIPNQVHAQETERYTYGDFEYEYYKDGICLKKYTGKEKEVYVPAMIHGTPVRHMDSTFENNKKIQKVHLPDTLITLNAFENCSNLRGIVIPKGVKVLGGFGSCKKLKQITIPYGVRVITNGAFGGCNIKSIEIPDSVTTLGVFAFLECSKLEEVKLSKRIDYIGLECFAYCKKLKSIELPDAVKYIDTRAFYECTSLRDVKLSKSLRMISRFAFENCDIRKITIPSKVTEMDEYIFASCDKLKKITIKGKDIPGLHNNAFTGIHDKAVFDVPNKYRNHYKQLLTTTDNFKEATMKMK